MSTKPVPKDFGLAPDGRLAISPAAFLAAHKPPPRKRPGLGDLVSKIATPIARALNLDCIDPETNNLKPDSGCAQRRDALNKWFSSPDPGYAFEVHLHGGLGDCFLDYYGTGSYEIIEHLAPGQRARIVIFSSNPFVHELFAWHPKRAQLDILIAKAWRHSGDDPRAAKELGIHYRPANPSPAAQSVHIPAAIRFYPSPSDLDFLSRITHHASRLVLISASAGAPERNLPVPILESVISNLKSSGYHPIMVGRSYDRDGRLEIPALPDCLDAIDKLSVPGTAWLLQHAAGLVTCHSSMNLLGWFLRKPQLLLYPEEVHRQHIQRGANKWAFGIGYPETIHGRFSEFCPDYFADFRLTLRGSAAPPRLT
jgi:hypothetical protein